MANAKKCDRCGKFYEERDPNFVEELAQSLNDLFTPKTVLVNISVIEKVLDLCPRCSRSLFEWAKNPDPHSKEEEPCPGTRLQT